MIPAKISTKERILNESRKLFFEKGYETTSIQDILSALDIAKGTFYHHFQSKEELLEEIAVQFAKEAHAAMQAEIGDLGQGSGLEKIRQALIVAHNWKKGKSEEIRFLLQSLFSPSNLQLRDKIRRKSVDLSFPLFDSLIVEGQADGSLKSRLRPDHLTSIIFDLSDALGEKVAFHLLGRGKETQDEIYELMLSYHKTIEELLGCPEGGLDHFSKEEWGSLTQLFKADASAPRTQEILPLVANAS
ncbi:TetR/AcrR family transcriptional regulator [Leptospira wolffii]|uniref:TetR family transcriptional regulator n=1 Tax=Leptospira wolffii TaxID=409998 RepID=A0A2M9Z8X8_9LEPT|nr:TetR/AcrR family transcriptional regulator [Leptospira wolffii]PJZ64865.1 TetR family transcriptional regulator [Leptospira wolffii]TGK58222.1 TetR/AcrR family transcriptional regulator [Leptospira wolffii]TGK66402.1 TetR/AcrR family transcriptional regulator [Leptospira wolffii]TGK68900.1 TetR/AcrR family transcriptional regulator [Leptospira wolffii]TGL27252.1 TetR/AcrR family transcriptional regulator [Leptospira wolffii]